MNIEELRQAANIYEGQIYAEITAKDLNALLDHLQAAEAKLEENKTTMPKGWAIFKSDDGFIRLVKAGAHGGAQWTVGYSQNSDIENEKAANMFLSDFLHPHVQSNADKEIDKL